MQHHLHNYGPKSPQITNGYKRSDRTSAQIWSRHISLGIAAVIFSDLTIMLATYFGLPKFPVFVFILTTIAWLYAVFVLLHEALHDQRSWITDTKWFPVWFEQLRFMHIRHHKQISEDGHMNRNYGICFFWFDRIFGTYCPPWEPLDKSGYQSAFERYSYILDEEFDIE